MGLRFEDAISILKSTGLESNPNYAEAFNLVKTYAFNYHMLTCSKGATYTPYRSDEGCLIGFKKEVEEDKKE